MAFEQKDNTFALFKNSRKNQPNHPDYVGDGVHNGELVELSCWLRISKKTGKTFMSGTIRPKLVSEPTSDVAPDEDVPFV